MSEPAGIVMPFAGSTAPQGYLLCDGSAVSRDIYSALFAAIGTVYGAGDGSTTFNLPNLSGRVVLGVSQSHALGSTGGEAAHTLTAQEMPAHTHTVPSHGHSNDIAATTPELSHSVTQAVFNYNSPNWHQATYSGTVVARWVYGGAGATNASRSANVAIADHAASDCTVTGSITNAPASDTSVVGGNAHNNLQPYQAVNYIISVGS